MIEFTESFLVWLASTLIPAFFGLQVITWANRRVDARYLSAFAFGIFLWFFLDTIGGAATLDVNSGFSGGGAQIGVVVLFLIGLLFFVGIDRNRGIFSTESAVGKYGLLIPILVAVAVGIHGLGEGAAFGGTAHNTLNTDLLDAFGGLTAGVAYVLHKGLEPMMIGACYCLYTKRQATGITNWTRDLLLLSIIFTLPSLIGAASGYFIKYETSYFFALGTGTSIYAAMRLAGPLFNVREATLSGYPIKITVALLVGFMAIYFAALFHSG